MSNSTASAQKDEEMVRIHRFMDWLIENGATFPKIDFPRNDTPSGIRGAIALEDIAVNEHMMVIPARLMMAPTHIFADPNYGPVLQRELRDLLWGDFLMTVYLMHEMRLGDASFYKPYIDILPVPNCISEWSDAELTELQDERIKLRAKNRKVYIQNSYKRVIHGLNRQYPDLFPLEAFPLKNFIFAFNTIQARAFGRRLPWTALVPFADCLNHTNVQTKYDYNLDNNGVFRLFPTGRNHYVKGSEVFNSYGKRENENLLMDYGFAMLPNHWDVVDIMLSMPHDDLSDAEYLFRRELLAQRGFKMVEIFPFSYFFFPMEALFFARCVTKSHHTSNGDNNNWIIQREDELRALTFLQTTLELHILQTFATDISQDEARLQELNTAAYSTVQDIEIVASVKPPQHTDLSSLKEDGEQLSNNNNYSTSDNDSLDVNIETTTAVTVNKDRYINALRYRLVRKQILQRSLSLLDTLIDWISMAETRSTEENQSILFNQIIPEYMQDAQDSDDGSIYVKKLTREKQHVYLRWVLDTLITPPITSV